MVEPHTWAQRSSTAASLGGSHPAWSLAEAEQKEAWAADFAVFGERDGDAVTPEERVWTVGPSVCGDAGPLIRLPCNRDTVRLSVRPAGRQAGRQSRQDGPEIARKSAGALSFFCPRNVA